MRVDRRWIIRSLGMAVAVATLGLMLATEPRMAIVWDEGFTLGRENRIRLWFQALRDPAKFAENWVPPDALELVRQDHIPPRREQLNSRGKLFERETLAWFWPFAREEPHGHPPFYALVGLIGDFLVPSWADLPRARLGPILVYSLTAGCLFGFVASRASVWAGALAVGAFVLQPRLFGHGHYAAYDALLTCLWVNAILAFQLAIEPAPRRSWPRWGWAVVLGLIFGWAADTKLTGWFLPLPFMAWAVFYRSKLALRVALVAAPVALLTLYAFNPGWWADPIGGIERFLRSNLNRGKTIPIEVLFLGTTYNTPIQSLPWYNTIVWTLMVTPIGFMALAVMGAVRAVSRAKSEPSGLLVLGHWGILLVLRALPHTPGHDGVRLFLPAFGVLSIMAGHGAAWLLERSARWGRIVITVALIEGVASVALMIPVPLSYYSPIVGGLPGAAKLGMEPTYYWDSLGDEALDFLNTHTGSGQVVRFATFPHSFIYLRKTGRLKASVVPLDRGVTAWYVYQNRPGAMKPEVRAFLDRAQPAFVYRKLGVPLLWIIPANPPALP